MFVSRFAPLSEQKIKERIPSGWTPMVFSRIDSTNAEARRQLAAGFRGNAVLCADAQTAGRGRLGRQFYSPDGSGLYVSFLTELRGAPKDVLTLTCAASVAVMRAIRSVTGLQVQIKWVNDLYFQDKKVGGILCECVPTPDEPQRRFLIIGIGINLYSTDFPAELEQVAGALEANETEKETLLLAILRELVPFTEHPEDKSYWEDYRKHSCVLGKEIVYLQNGKVLGQGTAVALDENGALLVLVNGRLEALSTGEISVRTVH